MPELTTTECDALLEIAQAALSSPGSDEWLEVVSRHFLGGLFHADVFAAATISRPGAPVHHASLAGTFAMIRPSWAEERVPTGSAMHSALLDEHPLTNHMLGPRSLVIVRVTDLGDPSAWRHMGGYSKMRELVHATNHLGMTISSTASQVSALSAIRSGKDFSDREVALARRMQLLLLCAQRHVTHVRDRYLSMNGIERDATGRAATALGLTERERVVLELIGQGLTAAAIARRLAVSVRTVSKHQQNIYRKLDVGDRLSAVLRAHRVGLLPVPGRPDPAR